MEVVGYERCRRCDALTPVAVWQRSNRLCERCIVAGAGPKAAKLVRVGGTVIPLRQPPRKGKKYKGAKATRQATKRAHNAALKELRDCFPDLYRLLYISARARQGLPPVPLIGTRPLDEEALARAVEAAGERLNLDGVYPDVVQTGAG